MKKNIKKNNNKKCEKDTRRDFKKKIYWRKKIKAQRNEIWNIQQASNISRTKSSIIVNFFGGIEKKNKSTRAIEWKRFKFDKIIIKK